MTDPTTSAHLHADLPMVKVKMTPRGPQPDDGVPTPLSGDLLPLSTHIPLLPTQSAQITGQGIAYKRGRLIISSAGTEGGGADWAINAFEINGVSQFVRAGDVPGDLFTYHALDDEIAKFIQPTPLRATDIVVIRVTYIGNSERGVSFFGALCADSDPEPPLEHWARFPG